MGYRYRLHRRDLPGTPDLVFGPRRKVIFVHGCFWHRQEGCHLARMAKSRVEFWQPKLEGNRLRDERNQLELKRLNWDVLVIWECEIKKGLPLRERIEDFLGSRGALRSVELFVGAGGLGMGLAQARFSHELVADRDSHACPCPWSLPGAGDKKNKSPFRANREVPRSWNYRVGVVLVGCNSPRSSAA